MSDTANCIFCRILAGTEPATFVWRDDTCAAFMDVQPVNPGHLLIVPLKHGAYLSDIEPETAAHMMRIAHTLTAALRNSDVRCEGVNLFLADGAAAMQEVFHTHLHVFPRYKGDGFGLTFSENYKNRPARKELEKNAESIKSAIKR